MLKKLLVAISLIATAPLHANENWAKSYEYETSGKLADAINALEGLPAQEKAEEFYWLRRGWLFYSMANYNEALASYKKAIDISPQSLDALLGAMLPLMAQQRWKEAANYGEQTVKIAPLQYYAHTRLMACEEALMQWQALFDRATRLAKHYPADATIWVYVARAASVLGKKNAAIDAYQKVLQRVPGHLEATRYLLTQ